MKTVSKTMKKIFGYGLLLLLLSFNVLAFSGVNETFFKANEHYGKAQYREAIELYEQILQNGYEAPEIYYNLGNAYYRLKKVPQAIISFERAKLLSPDDEEINFNLNVAYLRTVDKIEPLPSFFINEWIHTARSYYSSATWSVWTIIYSWICAISFALFLIFITPILRKTFFAIGVFSLILLMITFVFALQTSEMEKSRDKAIVFSPSVIVKSSPDNSSISLFTLHEGTKLQVLDKVSDWVKIRLADGNIGWMQEKAIERI